MKQMIRSQSDNFSHFNSPFLRKTQILYPSPQKRNISLEFKLKITQTLHEKPTSPESSSKISSLNSIEDFEVKSPLKMTKSVSYMDKLSQNPRKEEREELNFEELRRKESMNPHPKNFVEKEGESGMESGKTKEIDEAEDEEDAEENKGEMHDFDEFMNDIDEN